MTTDHLAEVLKKRRPRWMQHAACADADQTLFFPEVGQAGDDAKAICAECPVRAECLSWGLTEDFGIWGGLSLRQRNKLSAAGWKLGDPIPPVKMAARGLTHGAQRAYLEHYRNGETPCDACRAWKDRRRAMQRRNAAARLVALDGAA
jgi:hypothetical protein